ncbi:MAG: ATP-dependent DNA helicase RecG [Treponema sp.]|jgi:ATP-dependent DNA helicase RecG|nr:ATP-dependent DNA helicase RecG [Treponema sp.]
MFLRELKEPAGRIRGAGARTVELLAKAGIHTVADLLCHFPRDWEDRGTTVRLAQFAQYPQVNTTVTILGHSWIGFGRTRTLKVLVEDESAGAELLCWNRNFLKNQLIPGRRCHLWGHFQYQYGKIQSSSFEISPEGEEQGILPVYPLSGELNQTMLRRLVSRALESYLPLIDEELPREIIEKEGLLPRPPALRGIHFPSSMAELDRAKRTLIYGELFYLEIMVGRRAMERRTIRRSPVRFAAERSPDAVPEQDPAGATAPGNVPAGLKKITVSPLQRRLVERLPFKLTPGQAEAITEINRDMTGPIPMARLLQGDVGSGKTLVSFLAALAAVEGGGQAAILAPTELLARQHAENAARLLEPLGLRLSFLTGNIKASGRKELLKGLADGRIDMVLGTHALFSDDVVYSNLRLVVVDEQHRFGVIQRSLIMAKGNHPDLLMMSATPIPRTLALTVFGDLDVSVIRDLPPGRKAVKTHLARQSNEGKVYDFVRNELDRGRQAYFVYPLIAAAEEGRAAEMKDAQTMAARLAEEVFPQYPVALIHSRIDEEEKQDIMERFRRAEIRVLAATSVVEVGVDVPNATCMVVEHAERFGLSALHQLRGRVGRGSEQSYCFLVYSDDLTQDGKTRLKVMLEHTDGFVIAEEDLKLRGPGQITGIEQSGYLSLGLADPVRDAAELEKTRREAFSILEKDPGLLFPEHLLIAEVLKKAPPFAVTYGPGNGLQNTWKNTQFQVW